MIWKNIVDPDGPQMAIHCMHCAFLITKATDTHLANEILIASQLQQWLHDCASIFMLYVHCLSFFRFKLVLR